MKRSQIAFFILFFTSATLFASSRSLPSIPKWLAKATVPTSRQLVMPRMISPITPPSNCTGGCCDSDGEGSGSSGKVAGTTYWKTTKANSPASEIGASIQDKVEWHSGVDTCKWENGPYLIEYSCENYDPAKAKVQAGGGMKPMWNAVECPTGQVCSGGTCVQKVACEDGDHGKSYFTGSYVQEKKEDAWELGPKVTDNCVDDKILEEQVCVEAPGGSKWQSVYFDCSVYKALCVNKDGIGGCKFECDPDGDGYITDQFVDQHLLNKIREGSGLSGNAPIPVEIGLMKLYLHESNISDLTGLQCLTNLTDLIMHSNQVSDLTPLRELVNLTTLYAHGNQISDLTPLQELVNLTTLHAYDNQISDLTPLQGLVNLKDLRLNNNQISDLTPLQGLVNLGWLEMDNNQISDLIPLQEMVSLASLRLSSNQISDLTPLQGLVNLITLYIDHNQISDLIPLQGLTNLHNLYVNSNQINDLTPLKGLVNLRYLIMKNNDISDVTPLQGLVNLSILDLASNQINDFSPILNIQGFGSGAILILDIGSIPLAQLKALCDKEVNVQTASAPLNLCKGNY